ncbi:DUF3823 domain-containing protein [Chitinophaga sp. 30R24]|uniref:DUF3823 domain-containing protein n=1 Tax=Chitinophaga sp. 30R24 TaxID=3248838 RepID=UPI003B90B313
MKKMKRLKLLVTAITLLLSVSSCKQDNYNGPDSTIYGSMLDAKTNQLVEQDIINGTQIELIEQGFANPVSQYMVIKNDGTFRNALVFGGTYEIRPVRGNCLPMEVQRFTVKGNTKIDFLVQPYIRLQNVAIQKTGSKVVASFNLEQVVPGKVKKIGLYAHTEAAVGEPLWLVKAEQTIDSSTNVNTVYQLEIDLPSNPALKQGMQYFFRVGALIDVSEAKPNYATATRLTL